VRRVVLSLWDNALSWYSTLDNIIGFDKNIWNELKKKFLEAYAPKYSAKALCICFQDLRQKNDEMVQDFYNRVSTTFKNAYQSKPAHTTTYVGTLHGGITQTQADEIMGQGVTRMRTRQRRRRPRTKGCYCGRRKLEAGPRCSVFFKLLRGASEARHPSSPGQLYLAIASIFTFSVC
jgi:hypothetical protein